MSTFIVGIDDIATETQVSEGWGYFVLEERPYTAMETEVTALLMAADLPAFHAKKFIADQEESYRDFLKIIRTYSEKSAPSLCSCSLNNPNWKADFQGFCDRITENVLREVGVPDPELIEVLKQFVPSMFTLQRLSSSFGNSHNLKIEIDNDEIKAKFPNLSTILKGRKFSASFLLERLFNAYRRLQFLTSPEVVNNGIAAVRDAKSVAVQAADVIGNFSTSFIYCKLGNKSKKRILKGRIFESVFGDKFVDHDFSKHIALEGDNDLRIVTDGAYTFQFGML